MTSNTSLAAQAVANGPMTLAPPSFDGHGWLVVVNLATMTAAFVLFAMLACNMAAQLWRRRRWDGWPHPVTIWRLIGLGLGVAGTIRFGIAATVLWRWDPRDAEATAWLLTMQRLVDPVSVVFAVAAIGLYKVSERGMIEQLVKKPRPIKMWASLPMLRRSAAIVVLSLIAAIGMVSTR